MSKSNRTYNRLFYFVIIGLALATAYALKQKEVPRFILFLGRFHPLLLHLPIGALVLTFFIDVRGRFQRNYPSAIVRSMLGFTALFAILTSFFGYFLSLEGGYLKETLDLHLYTGILTAVLTSTLFFVSRKERFQTRLYFFPLFVLTLISISVAGHFGSVLTHGDQFLTEYAKAPEQEQTIEQIDSLRLYKHVVAKILDQKCVQCHNASKRKGELSLLTQSDILKGGEHGTILKTGNALNSKLYTYLTLPISDDDHMPPEGKEQLTKKEIWLIKHWIDNGASFKNYADVAQGGDTLAQLLESYLVLNEEEIPIAAEDDVEEVIAAGFRVVEIVPGKGALHVKCIQAKPFKKNLDELRKLEDQIVELDFGTSEVSDEMTDALQKLKRLKSLRINSKSITDVSLKNLKTLKELEVLNLYNTDISGEGLKDLLASIQPRKLYVWKTKVDLKASEKLALDYGIDIQNGLQSGFVENSRLEMPGIKPDGNLFTDSIMLNVSSRLKNVNFRYTLNGDEPDSLSNKLKKELILRESKTLKIAAFKKGWDASAVRVEEYAKVLDQVSDFTLQNPSSENYAPGNKLFDLKEGSLAFADGEWTAYFGPDLIATIDLGKNNEAKNIAFNCLEDVGSWILYPKEVIVYASSSKNSGFREVNRRQLERKGEGGEASIKRVTLSLNESKARYFKIHIKNYRVLPDWHPSAGNPSWLFVDEIYFW
jgi:uncharacterized membrane protein/Leucine-rich repeat (LRR) protein